MSRGTAMSMKNIGFCLRGVDHLFHVLGADDDSGWRRWRRGRCPPDGDAGRVPRRAPPCRRILRPVVTARSKVRLVTMTPRTPLFRKCLAASSHISPAPISITVLSDEIAEDLFGQLHRGKGHGNGRGGDFGFGAHPFGNGKGLVQKAVQDDAGGLVFRGITVGCLDLAQDLRFSHHHGVEAGGNPEDDGGWPLRSGSCRDGIPGSSNGIWW